MNFSITENQESVNSDYGLTQMNFTVKISDRERTFDEASEDIHNMFTQISEFFIRKMNENDKIRIVFNHDDFSTSIDLPFVSRNKFTARLLIDSFENVIQSFKDSYVSSNSFKVTVQIQSMPIGSGRKCLGIKKKQKPYIKVTKINNNILDNLDLYDIQEYCNRKKSIIKVINNDHLCLVRAVLIAIKYLKNDEKKEEYAKANNKELNRDVEKICKKIYFPNTGSGIPEIKNLELYLRDYCITLFDGHSPKDAKPLYRGLVNKYFINLLLTKSHYNVITSMPAYLKRSYYCDFCIKSWNDYGVHKCPNI